MAYPDPLVKAVARGEPVDGSKVSHRVVDSAIEHRIAPLLLRAVEDHPSVPTDAAAALMAFDMAVVSRRQEQDRVLQLVHQRLTEASVTHTYVKGPASAVRWFVDPTSRPYSDIDVIVPIGSPLASAVAALSPAHPVLELFGEDEAMRFLSSVEIVVDGVRVDLQTDALRTGLIPNSYEDWSVGTDQIGEAPGMRVLDPEHDLIMFLLHQGRDRFRFLLGVAEARLRLSEAVEWDRVEALARREGIWDQVAVALEVMCEELQIDVPVAAPTGWRAAMWRRLWNPRVRFLGELGRIRHIVRGRWLMPLTMRGRTLEATRWLFRSMFPPDLVIRHRYPAATGPYLWRALFLRARIILRRRYRVWRERRR